MIQEAYNSMAAIENDHWWFVARRKILKVILEKILASQSKDSLNILEIGCGSGGNLDLLSNYGNLNAMELNEHARAKANERNICSVKYGKLPENIPYNECFDLVCLFDVLEHIEDDKAALLHIRSKLNMGGSLFLTVPAYNLLWGPHDVISHHKRRYNKKDLCNVLRETGFRIDYCSYFNIILFPLIAIGKLLQRFLTKAEASNTLKSSNRVLNFVLQSIFSMESVVLPKISLPFGASIVCVVKKV